MRRATALGAENSADIEQLKGEMAAPEKSLTNVEGLSDSVEVLKREVAALLKWQQEVVNPGLHKNKETEQRDRERQRKTVLFRKSKFHIFESGGLRWKNGSRHWSRQHGSINGLRRNLYQCVNKRKQPYQKSDFDA